MLDAADTLLELDARYIAKSILSRPVVTDFRKGQILFLRTYGNYNVAVKVLRVNKHTLTVYRIGMSGNKKSGFVPMSERVDKIYKINLVNQQEMSVYEAAVLLYYAKLKKHSING